MNPFHKSNRHNQSTNFDMRNQGKGQRGFGHGGLRLVALHLISQKPQHGYELIKAIEQLTEGNYRPSAGVVYPLLNQMVEQKLLESLDPKSFDTSSTKTSIPDKPLQDEDSLHETLLESKKQVYQVTALGQQLLQEKSDKLYYLLQNKPKRNEQSIMVIRAVENLRYAIQLKLSHATLNDEQSIRLATLLDETVQKIDQL